MALPPPDGRRAGQVATLNSSVTRGIGMLCAEAHPSRPVFAAAGEDGSVHIWAFGEPTPRFALPRPPPEQHDPRRRASSIVVTPPLGAGGRQSTTTHIPGVPSSQTSNREATGMSAQGGATAEVGECEQRKCQLTWNLAGDRLLGVGNATGVTLWTVGEGKGACQVYRIPTGSAQTKVNY